MSVRNLWPYLGIALAVALGIALAPFVWWAVLLVVIAVIGWWARRWLRVGGLLGVVLLPYAWPVWLWRRGQLEDALFAAVVVSVIVGWTWIRRPLIWVRDKVFPD